MLLLLKKTTQQLRQQLRLVLAANHPQAGLPKNPMAEDIFFVSYPKSGNTWVRFLIANAIKVHYRIEYEVNFFTVEHIIPHIYHSGDLSQLGPFGRADLPRIIKSHHDYTPRYNRVILLVRDPRDVMVSYYRYLLERRLIPADWAISTFIRDRRYGAKRWADHTRSWYLTFNESQNIQLFHYEKFLQDPEQQLGRLMSLLGILMPDYELQEAIALSSRERMRKQEKLYSSTYMMRELKTSFVNQAKPVGGKSLTESDRQFIEAMTQDAAQRVGYDFSSDDPLFSPDNHHSSKG